MVFVVGGANAQTLILQEDFSSPTLAGLTITQTSATQTELENGFDYSTVGIPSAPNGTGTHGLRTACNLTAGANHAINVYLDTPVPVDRFMVQVDIWLNFADSGTTEHAGAGIFASGTKVNYLHNYNSLPTDTDGLMFGFNSDSDEALSDLYLVLGDAAGPIDVGVWNNPDDSTPLGQYSDAAYYDPVADLEAPDILGEQWVTLTMTYDDSLVMVKLNDLDVAIYSNAAFRTTSDHQVFVGHSDPFGGVASPVADSFCVFDNLKVYELPTPLSATSWMLYN
jgi:hypothetical protein